ncbi:MAG TPA: glycoside hydrolase, partial [Ktedonobacteraceae bacterium]
MSSSKCLNATRKGNLKLLLTLCAIVLIAQIIIPSSSLHAQGMRHVISTASPAAVTINGAKQYQTIDGFGFSGAFGAADQLRTLSSTNDQTQILDLLFNTSTGAGFSILRNLLPSDTTHTIEPNNPGSPTATPQYAWDNNSWGQVWLAKQAQNYGLKQFYLDAWSAPGFMKTNGDEANGGTLCGAPGTSGNPTVSCNSADWRQAYANYLLQYIQDYTSDSIPITDIDFINEPNLKTSYSSMVMTPTQTADFVKVLGPTLRASSFHPQIACCDEQGWDLAQSYTNAITSNPTANGYVGVISSHGYTGFPTFTLTGTGQKHIWQTEWSTFDAWNPSWDDGSDASGFTW